MQNVSLTEHFAPPGVVAISQKSYDSLPDDLKEYLTESAIRFGKMEREMDEKLQEEMKKKLEEKVFRLTRWINRVLLTLRLLFIRNTQAESAIL